jgi:hypothetical protein
MLFVLVTSSGATLEFNVLGCAQLYQSLYGGKIHTEFIIVEDSLVH